MEVQEKVRLTHQIQTHILNRAIYPNNIATQVIRKLLGERYDDKYIEKGYTYTVLLRTYYYSYFNDSETPPKLRQYTQSQVPIGFLVDKTQTTWKKKQYNDSGTIALWILLLQQGNLLLEINFQMTDGRLTTVTEK